MVDQDDFEDIKSIKSDDSLKGDLEKFYKTSNNGSKKTEVDTTKSSILKAQSAVQRAPRGSNVSQDNRK